MTKNEQNVCLFVFSVGRGGLAAEKSNKYVYFLGRLVAGKSAAKKIEQIYIYILCII